MCSKQRSERDSNDGVLALDDLKVSHVDPKENTRFGDWMSETYGVTVVAHQGAVHDYLGMIFDFSVKKNDDKHD